jgi:phosphoglycerol transferase MdoB-like AlkP superfamily enzyme
MDYAVLSGGRPSKHMISYLVPDIPYDHATPRFMQRHGYRTMALHGNSGEFFRRRANFQRMGFDQLYFQEDFCKGAVTRSYWGVRDVELFRLSAQKLRQASGPEFHFIITLDSHVPFDLISEVEKEMYPRSQSWQENYFNSLRVLDRSVCEYVKSLPAGTLVILYGDHTSGVNCDGFRSAVNGEAEYVPCLIHVCGAPRTAPAPMNGPEALPKDLCILDVMNCLRHQVAAQKSRRLPVGIKV